MKPNHRSLYLGLLLLFLFSGSFAYIRFLATDPPLYKKVERNKKVLAEYPVRQLITSVTNGQFHLVKDVFEDSDLAEEFYKAFGISILNGTKTGGFFEEHSTTIEIKNIVPLSKSEWPDFTIDVEIYYLKEKTSIQFTSEFDLVSMRYLISEMNISGNKYSNSSGRSTSIEIPSISESPCIEASGAGYQYIHLKHKNETGQIQESKFLGDVPYSKDREVVPGDYYGTEAISQAPFSPLTFTYENPKYIACRKVSPKFICDGLFDRWKTETYDAGNVLNFEDAMNLKIENIFGQLTDSDGVLEIQGENYPTAFFTDKFYDRVTIITADNDVIFYGGEENQFHFTNPKKITVVGNYLYVLNGDNDNEVVVLSFELHDGKLRIDEVGPTDFGIDLTGSSDIAGFSSGDLSVLFISNSSKNLVTRLPIDPATGLLMENEIPISYRNYVDLTGRKTAFSGNTAMEINPLNSTTGKCVMLVVQNPDKVLALSTEAFVEDSPLELNYSHYFPRHGNVIYNIGYNLGNHSFVATDIMQHKVHVFSGMGDYLGSGGRFGKGEGNSEFFYPNLISSNTFSTEAIEMVVGSEWSYQTGFKRVFPRADIGKVEIVEKAPLSAKEVANNSLLFRYGLTAGYNVDNIKFYLNGTNVREISGEDVPFPDVYAESFLVNGTGDEGIKEELVLGWNTFEIELTAHLEGPENADLAYTKKKNVEFYYMPSLIDGSFEISDSEDADIYHDVNNPFYLYKSTFVNGEGELIIRNGKIVLTKGCSLLVASERALLAENEIFEFQCGSNLEIAVEEEVNKTFSNCTFDGTRENFNMVSTLGEYTGGQGSGSAPSSVLEFLECSFENYYGKALYVREGRPTLVNCDFTGLFGSNSSNTSVGILCNPDTRMDLRGTGFYENHIAIDASSSDLYIGHAAVSYKGIKVRPTLFENNIIGIHAFNGYSEIQKSTFTNHQGAIVDIGGEVNISRNSENRFEGNQYAVLFTNELDAQSGKNFFIDNIEDATYLPLSDRLEDRNFNFTCNYWEKDGTQGTPGFNVLRDSIAGEELPDVSFVFVPYLENKGKGNGENFTCTGRDTNDRSYGRQSSELISREREPPVILRKVRSSSGVSDLQKVITDYDAEIYFGAYSDSHAKASGEALFKNALLSKLYRISNTKKRLSEMKEGLTYIPDHREDRFVAITQDKLSFLNSIEKGGSIRHIQVTRDIDPGGTDLHIYPNPAIDQVTVTIRIKEEGNYTVKLLNISGFETATLVENKPLTPGYFRSEINLSGFPSGMYIVRCFNDSGDIFMVKSLIKN